MAEEHRTPARRSVLRGAAALGAAAAAAGCGGSPGPGVAPGVGAVVTPSAGDPVLGTTTDIPVGGGVVYAAQHIVVTQPEPGRFVGLSTTCTHQGCGVSGVTDGTVVCPCHGSRFHLDGSVASGPATRPLDSVAIVLQGNQIVVDIAPAAATGY